ncbi:MAG: hypothetical protein M5R36_01600 [Deltaproteobacteria bacterium]|nr:hypothetical protein [Deltaproteobacteria bacterium]
MLVHAVAAQNGIKITIPWRRWLVAAVIFSLFFGLVVSAVGIGVYPRMGLVAAPFLLRRRVGLSLA